MHGGDFKRLAILEQRSVEMQPVVLEHPLDL